MTMSEMEMLDLSDSMKPVSRNRSNCGPLTDFSWPTAFWLDTQFSIKQVALAIVSLRCHCVHLTMAALQQNYTLSI